MRSDAARSVPRKRRPQQNDFSLEQWFGMPSLVVLANPPQNRFHTLCSCRAWLYAVVTLGKAKELPLLSKLQKVCVALTQVFKAQSIVTKQRWVLVGIQKCLPDLDRQDNRYPGVAHVTRHDLKQLPPI